MNNTKAEITKAAAKSQSAAPNEKNTEKDKYSPSKRWSSFLAEGGHTPVVNYFLDHYHSLIPPITSGEAMFIIHLMYFKWGEAAPFPGYKTIAKKMGVTDKTVRRHAQELEGKKYLRREIRENQPNIFHLQRLIDALEAHKRANVQKRKTDK